MSKAVSSSWRISEENIEENQHRRVAAESGVKAAANKRGYLNGGKAANVAKAAYHGENNVNNGVIINSNVA